MTIEEFLQEIRPPLDQITSADPDDREFIKREPERAHFGLGMWIRNNWGLWKGGNGITDFFHDHGIWHADDMSAIILESYSRLLKEVDVRFHEQVQSYLDYWKRKGVDSKEELRKIVETEQHGEASKEA